MGRKKDRRILPWGGRFWVLNQTWTKAFMISHIFGWATAFFQTFWIVYELRKGFKKLGVQNSIELHNHRRNQS